MKRIEAMLTDEKAERLKAWAKERNCSRSEVIVALVNGLLEGQIPLGVRTVMIEQTELHVSPSEPVPEAKGRRSKRES